MLDGVGDARGDLASVGSLMDGWWLQRVWMGVVCGALSCCSCLAMRESFYRAEEGVVVGTVANAFIFDRVLCSEEFQGCRVQDWKSVIIQGRVRSVAHCTANVKVDVLEFDCLRAGVGSD